MDIKTGKLIEEGDIVSRDAIHIAMSPEVAGERLLPGQHVGIDNGEERVVVSCLNPVGIVDPLLKDIVEKGQKFWLWVYPNTVTGMRHHWQHPDFEEELREDYNKADAVSWVQDYCKSLGVEYDELMSHAKVYLGSHYHYWSEGSLFDGECLPDVFWDKYEIITGTTVKDDDRGSFFSCSC